MDTFVKVADNNLSMAIDLLLSITIEKLGLLRFFELKQETSLYSFLGSI